MKRFIQFRFAMQLPLILFALGIIISAIFTCSVYAQPASSNSITPPKEDPNSATVAPSSSFAVPKLHAVKITSPTKGQQVPIGKDLVISGISLANATSHCQVSVIVNGIKPYQPATGTGTGGTNDYSKWNFTLTPTYTTIKEGPNNKIISKYFCSSDPSLASFYSVNVTGISTATAAPIKQQQQPTTIGNNTGTAAKTMLTTSSSSAPPISGSKQMYLGTSDVGTHHSPPVKATDSHQHKSKLQSHHAANVIHRRGSGGSGSSSSSSSSDPFIFPLGIG